MLRRIANVTLLAAMVAGFTGCGPQGVKEEVIPIKPQDPFQEVKAVLQNYANGQVPTSEVSDFPRLIENAKKADPAKGELVEKALTEIQKNPGSAKAKAQELLGKL